MRDPTYISKWNFDVTIANGIEIETTYNCIGTITANELSNITESLLSQHFSEKAYVQIHTISLNLGVISIETLESSIIEAFEIELDLELKKLKSDFSSEQSEQLFTNSNSELTVFTPFDIVIHYLLHGYFPGIKVSHDEIKELLLEVIQNNRPNLLTFFRSNIAHNHALHRFTSLLAINELRSFIEQTVSIESSDIQFVHSFVRSISEHFNTEIRHSSLSEFEVWELLFSSIIASHHEKFGAINMALDALKLLTSPQPISLVQIMSEMTTPESAVSILMQRHVAKNADFKRLYEGIVSEIDNSFDFESDFGSIASNYIVNGLISKHFITLQQSGYVYDLFAQWIDREFSDSTKLAKILVHHNQRKRFISLLHKRSFHSVLEILTPRYAQEIMRVFNTMEIKHTTVHRDLSTLIDLLLSSIVDDRNFDWNDPFFNPLRTKMDALIHVNTVAEKQIHFFSSDEGLQTSRSLHSQDASTRTNIPEESSTTTDENQTELHLAAVYYWLTEGQLPFWAPSTMYVDPYEFTKMLSNRESVRLKKILLDAVLRGISHQIQPTFLLQEIRSLQPKWSFLDDHISFLDQALSSYNQDIDASGFDNFIHEGLQLLLEVALLEGSLEQFENQFKMRMARLFGIHAQPSFLKQNPESDSPTDQPKLPYPKGLQLNDLQSELSSQRKYAENNILLSWEKQEEPFLPQEISEMENWLIYYLKNGCWPKTNAAPNDHSHLLQLVKSLFISDANKLRNILSGTQSLARHKLLLYEIILHQNDQISQNISYLVDDYLQRDVETYFSELSETENLGSSSLIKHLFTNKIMAGRFHDLLGTKMAFTSTIARMSTLGDSYFYKLLDLFDNLIKTDINEIIYILKLIHSDATSKKRSVQLFREYTLSVLFHQGQLPTHKQFPDFLLYLRRKSDQDIYTLHAHLIHFANKPGIALPLTLKSEMKSMQQSAAHLLDKLSTILPQLVDGTTEKPVGSIMNLDENNIQPAISKHDMISVANAGLILIHPFIPTLLKKLNYTNGIDFHLPEDKERALCMFSRLVSPQSDPLEYNLTLPKILCSYPLDHSPRLAWEPDRDEEAEIQSLFDAIRQQWLAMKNTSNDGLRTTFLQRSGSLIESEDFWNLKIEPTSIDILLQTLPWGMGYMKYPWMKKPIKIEWI
ncbi:MAG: contractile injection system tape measure protein [Flavobacteriales bacterium]